MLHTNEPGIGGASIQKWRDLPGDFPAWQTVYTYFRNWRIDGTWTDIHDRLRAWTRAATKPI